MISSDADGDRGVSEHPPARDEYRVALVKSLATNNRFHALVPRASAIGNAGTVEEMPHDLLLGIAYPCLEDGLNDFAVIRTAYETLDAFDDEEMRQELGEIIADARRALARRLMELLERVLSGKAHFLGADTQKFKRCALELIQRGCSRHNLDAVMKVNVFTSVAEAALEAKDAGVDSTFYRYEFHNSEQAARLAELNGRDFMLSLYADVLDSVLDESNYLDKYTFDRYIFQPFIALLFTTYAATDPVFYGTHADDYGVCKGKDMQNTPLYRAVAQELLRIATLTEEYSGAASHVLELTLPVQPSIAELAYINFERPNAAEDQTLPEMPRLPDAPRSEDLLLGPLASICAIARHLRGQHPGETAELAQLILADASRVVQEMKRLNVLSPLAADPGQTEPPAAELISGEGQNDV
jgi:hypothetical protein